MSIILLFATYWKAILAVIGGLTALIFGGLFAQRGAQIKADQQAIKGYQAKEEVQTKVQSIETKANEQVREVKSAPKDSLLNRLNDLPK